MKINILKDYQNVAYFLFKTTTGRRQKRKKTINTHNPFYKNKCIKINL